MMTDTEKFIAAILVDLESDRRVPDECVDCGPSAAEADRDWLGRAQ